MESNSEKVTTTSKEIFLMIIDLLNELNIQYWIEGGWFELEAKWFSQSVFEDRVIPCVSVEGQKIFHSGYELRAVDQVDLKNLNAAFPQEIE